MNLSTVVGFHSALLLPAALPLLLLLGDSCSPLAGSPPTSREYHVSVRGDDGNDGAAESMLRTISAAALRAGPGDTIVVHEGVYRERVDPPRGGESDQKRIQYVAAPGERVVIKGSERVEGWEKVEGDVWKVAIPEEYFGEFNPFRDAIRGDWFSGRGRSHHTGAVYLDGHWLTEAARLEDVLQPTGETPFWFSDAGATGGYLLNVAWLQAGASSGEDGRTPATRYAAQKGILNAPCEEGGECIGFIEDGDWVRYGEFDFGRNADRVSLRVASATTGGRIELRLDGPEGTLLGTCTVPNTEGWQSWISLDTEIPPTSGVKTLCLSFRSPTLSDPEKTTIWAQFPGVDPNRSEVEINVRQAVFYPEEPGINFLTVRGFALMHAATPWSPPTAEQIGLIGTHWSKGWIIEKNDISYSTCVGLTLGKHGDQWDNTSQNSAEGYVETINRGLANGWSRENIGHHVVRNNTISHCEQAGLVGSLGAVFSTITGNVIHDIHVRQLFTGAEMAGIKIHGAIDTEISHNHIYRTNRGIWLDWMAQGSRVTGNLLHDNQPSEDLFMEVDHGPYLIDNNVFLSQRGLLLVSRGGAFVHNLIAGGTHIYHFDGRLTPYHPAHSTEVAGLHDNPSGDDRFYNNLFVDRGDLSPYDEARLPVWMAGNVFPKGTKPSKHEPDALCAPEFDPTLELVETAAGLRLQLRLDASWAERPRTLVTTELLGKAKIPDLPFEQPDGSPYVLDMDYFGVQRAANPFPGPFELPGGGKQNLVVWPIP